MTDKKLIIGIDGGGTKTSCVLFDSAGSTIDLVNDKGSNIYVYKEEGVKTILNIIRYILDKNKINYLDIIAYGIGIAGISDLNFRDVLLKEFDRG